MRIFITGVAGFIGSSLADRLVEDGHEVVGIDNLATGRVENVNPAVEFDHPVNWFSSFRYDKCDLIIHCAASYKDPDAWNEDTYTNIGLAQIAGGCAQDWDARVIYFQTVLPPISSYAISKIAGEHYLRLSGQPLTVFRLAAVYGPRNLSGAIPTFYRQVSEGKPCTVVEDATRDFVFVEDLVETVCKSIAEGWHGSHDIRTGVETPIRHIPHLIGQMLDIGASVKLVPRRDDDVAHYEMDGFQMEEPTPFVNGLRKAVEWYEQNGVSDTYTHLKLGATNAS